MEENGNKYEYNEKYFHAVLSLFPFPFNLPQSKAGAVKQIIHSVKHHSVKRTSCNTHCVKRVRIRRFFWFVSSHIRTEYGEIRSISPYLVRMRENADQKKLRIWTLFTQ